MRGASAILLVVAVAGCGPTPPPAVAIADAGVVRRDGSVVPPRDGGSVDAFHWPDTGPQPPPVLPRQAWTMQLVVGGDSFVLTVNIDARATSGIARGVTGAGGRASNVVFDVLPGDELRARSAILLGLPGVHTCGADTVALEDFRLHFADDDGDGVAETLRSVVSDGNVTRTGPFLPMGITTFEAIRVNAIAPDVVPPTVSVLQPALLAGLDPMVVVASEPIEPSFMPRLTGPRTIQLRPVVGASAPARWTASTRDLPPGHYTLELTQPTDVGGLAATAPLPTFTMDVPEGTLPIDDLDPSVVAVLTAGPATILGDDAGETALRGATSLLFRGRAAIALDSPPGTHQVQAVVRVAGPAETSFASSFWSVYDASGVLLSQVQFSSFLSASTSTPGFDLDDGVGQTVGVSYAVTRASRIFAVLDLGGLPDPTCGGVAPAGLGAVIDGVVLSP